MRMCKNWHKITCPCSSKLKGPSAKFKMIPDAKRYFIKARKVPFALREKVNQELKRLQNEGIISPVRHSDYATPIVPVIKRDGSVTNLDRARFIRL